MGNMRSSVADKPFKLPHLNVEYNHCLHNAHCNNLNSFNERRNCKKSVKT